MTTLRDRLIKIGGKIVRHGRYVTFQMAEVAIPRDLFADILSRIERLRPKASSRMMVGTSISNEVDGIRAPTMWPTHLIQHRMAAN